MEYVMEYLLNGLIILGALILVIALVGTQKLIRQLPKGKVRSNWYVLRVLIVVFIIGYISYTVVRWNDNIGHAGNISYYVVPLIYFLGACFVFLVINFALDTAVYVRHFAVLELENITDPLLGIHNRRYFDHRIDYEVKRAVRYKTPLSLLFIDVDHFTQLNDTYGRQVGDFVLTSLGKVLLNAARATDIVARYGGEQIMIIATNTPVTSIPVYAERLRRTVEEAVLMPPGEFTKGQVVRVTVSIGVSGFGSEIFTAQAMVKSAEEALRDAKARGRNIVIVNKPGSTD